MISCGIRSLVLCAASTSIAALGNAKAENFYAGKTVTMVVGSSSGSGFDVYARAVARHITRHLPGQPGIIVRNMDGAGGVVAAEWMANIAPKDGTVIAVLHPGAIVKPLIEAPGRYRYNPTTLVHIGAPDSGTRLCSTSFKSKVQTFEDARKYQAVIGATAPGGSTFDYPTMLNRLTGTKFKVVSGYKSTPSIALATERGEADGWCGVDVSTYMSVRPQWIPKREVTFLVQLGLEPNAELTAAGFPSIWKFVPAENKKVMELILAQQDFQRPFIAPPGISAERVADLRSAFDATMTDKQFLGDAAKTKLSVNPRTGKQVKKLVEDMFAAPKDVVQRMAKALAP
jgi:tripartite-type tricarboxylate transporter receptor subunit TctC